MAKMEQLESDLGYVRHAVLESERTASPAAIYYLWAAIVPVGFALVDLAPRWLGLYWMISGPGGGLLSAWLGWRASRRLGQEDRAEGLRHAMHWAAMLVAISFMIPLAATGMLTWDGLSVAILVVIALGYFLAGVHLDRPLLWIGLLFAAGYPVVLLVPFYPWTLLGLLVAVALVVSGIVVGRASAARES